jgi:dTDP-4-dehydrorhamnose reductase
MRILLIGANGQVAWELQRTLMPLGEVIALGRNTPGLQLDITDLESVRRVIQEIHPHVIVNPAAYTAVDKAESEPELAMVVNGIAPGVMAEEAKRLNIPLIHYSTDYVFSGQQQIPYKETDQTNPQNVYGQTKLVGEQAIQAVGGKYFIFRTSWVYGLHSKNFLLTILKLAREREELRVVNDQMGAPTWSRAIAEMTSQILAQGMGNLSEFSDRHTGLYHLSASGETSWYDFTQAILRLDPKSAEHRVQRVIAIPTEQYPTPAQRPANSLLDNSKLVQNFGLALPHWHKSLELAFE